MLRLFTSIQHLLKIKFLEFISVYIFNKYTFYTRYDVRYGRKKKVGEFYSHWMSLLFFPTKKKNLKKKEKKQVVVSLKTGT